MEDTVRAVASALVAVTETLAEDMELEGVTEALAVAVYMEWAEVMESEDSANADVGVGGVSQL